MPRAKKTEEVVEQANDETTQQQTSAAKANEDKKPATRGRAKQQAAQPAVGAAKVAEAREEPVVEQSEQKRQAPAQETTAQQETLQVEQDVEQTSQSTQEPVLQHQQLSANQANQLKLQANRIVGKYSVWGAGAGLVPMPVWDLVAISTVQVMMLKELYALYGVSFNEKKARTTVHLLLAGLSPRLLAGASASSLLKMIPVVGTSLASVTLPILSSAATYATGRLMVSHLSAGGSLNNFDIEANKAKFKQEVENAVKKVKDVAQTVKQSVKETPKNA